MDPAGFFLFFGVTLSAASGATALNRFRKGTVGFFNGLVLLFDFFMAPDAGVVIGRLVISDSQLRINRVSL